MKSGKHKHVSPRVTLKALRRRLDYQPLFQWKMNPRSSPEQSIFGKDLVETERAVEIERLPDGENTLTFRSKIVTK